MDETVRILYPPHPSKVLHGAYVQLLLSNMEHIITRKKGVTEKDAHIFRDGLM